MQVRVPWGPSVQEGVTGSQCAGQIAMGSQCAGRSPRTSMWRYDGHEVPVCR